MFAQDLAGCLIQSGSPTHCYSRYVKASESLDRACSCSDIDSSPPCRPFIATWRCSHSLSFGGRLLPWCLSHGCRCSRCRASSRAPSSPVPALMAGGWYWLPPPWAPPPRRFQEVGYPRLNCAYCWCLAPSGRCLENSCVSVLPLSSCWSVLDHSLPLEGSLVARLRDHWHHRISWYVYRFCEIPFQDFLQYAWRLIFSRRCMSLWNWNPKHWWIPVVLINDDWLSSSFWLKHSGSESWSGQPARRHGRLCLTALNAHLEHEAQNEVTCVRSDRLQAFLQAIRWFSPWRKLFDDCS